MELAEAELILGLCERFHCLPNELFKESGELFRWLALEQLGKTKDA